MNAKVGFTLPAGGDGRTRLKPPDGDSTKLPEGFTTSATQPNTKDMVRKYGVSLQSNKFMTNVKKEKRTKEQNTKESY